MPRSSRSRPPAAARGCDARDVLHDDGPPCTPARARDNGRTVTAFSGGKDSLLQLGLLAELGQRPIARVMTTSPMPPMHDHTTPRRRALMAEIVLGGGPSSWSRCQAGLYGSALDNDFARLRGHQIAVYEITDTFLYLAAAVVVGWLRGAPRIFLASEAELQETVVRAGHVVHTAHSCTRR